MEADAVCCPRKVWQIITPRLPFVLPFSISISKFNTDYVGNNHHSLEEEKMCFLLFCTLTERVLLSCFHLFSSHLWHTEACYRIGSRREQGTCLSAISADGWTSNQHYCCSACCFVLLLTQCSPNAACVLAHP